jgi:hypothetical protein
VNNKYKIFGLIFLGTFGVQICHSMEVEEKTEDSFWSSLTPVISDDEWKDVEASLKIIDDTPTIGGYLNTDWSRFNAHSITHKYYFNYNFRYY